MKFYISLHRIGILIIVSIFLLLFISMPIRAEKTSCAALLGDFMVSLINLEREGATANLEFSVTKVADSNSGYQSLVVYLIDDHENEYKGNLRIDLEETSDFILNTIPKGFTYMDTIEISMPKIAPIKVIKLGDIEIPFKDIIFNQPKLKQDFGSYNVKPGTIFDIGKYLKFNIEGPNAGVSGWTLAVTVKNAEYNPIGVGIRVGTQFADGQVRWGCGNNAEVPGAGQKTFRFQIVLSPLEDVVCWSQPIMLIIKCWGGGTKALKLLPLTYADFSPLPERIAYHNGQSVYVMSTNGTEISRLCNGKNPTWTTDGSKIIFGEGNRLSIVTADGSAKSQFYVSKKAALPRGSINPVYSPDGKKIAFQKGVYVKDKKGYTHSILFIHTINADGLNLACLHKGACPSWSPDGSQIAFSYGEYVQRGSYNPFETYICVMNNDGSGVTKVATLKTGKLAGPPAWSPDMTKLAFSCANQIYIMNVDGSNVIIPSRGNHPSWAPATKFVTRDSLK